MQIHKIQLNSSFAISNINLAIGNFDGVHQGHQQIIKKLISYSKDIDVPSGILSFNPHPRKFFSGKYRNFNIMSENSKISYLEKLGIEYYFSLKFNNIIASLTPQQFIKKILINQLKIKNLVVGFDFKFGKDRLGDVQLLQNFSKDNNFSVYIIPSIKNNATSEKFSSSLIRRNIQDGNVEKSNALLGRNWSMHGTVIHGDKRAGKINFPTANLIPPNLIHPIKGVYVVRAIIENIFFNGIANFGERPTVDGNKLLLEVHLFEFNENIYGKDLTVEFLTFIREEKKFDDFSALTIQIQKDIEIAKKYHLKN